MLRGKTVLAVAELYELHFDHGGGAALRDFWLAHDYPDEWLKWAKQLTRSEWVKDAIISKRGEEATMVRLTQDILNRDFDRRQGWEQTRRRAIEDVIRNVELDGYRFEGGRLRKSEEHAIPVEEATGVLRTLYRSCGLPEYDQVDHDLKGSEEHYRNGVWGDSIKRVRDVLETTLFQIARARTNATRVPDGMQPRQVRDILHSIGFHDDAEHRFSCALYGLISEHGGHPNMAERENALLCRQHVLTAMHFVLLRYQSLTAPATAAAGEAPTP